MTPAMHIGNKSNPAQVPAWQYLFTGEQTPIFNWLPASSCRTPECHALSLEGLLLLVMGFVPLGPSDALLH